MLLLLLLLDLVAPAAVVDGTAPGLPVLIAGDLFTGVEIGRPIIVTVTVIVGMVLSIVAAPVTADALIRRRSLELATPVVVLLLESPTIIVVEVLVVPLTLLSMTRLLLPHHHSIDWISRSFQYQF
jgi:hypothetical protein